MKERELHPGHLNAQCPEPKHGQGVDSQLDRGEKKARHHHHDWDDGHLYPASKGKGDGECREASDLDILLLQQLRHCGHMLHHRRNENQSQNRILMCLNHNGTMSQKQLAEHMRIQAGSLSEVVAKVEAGGYIQRQRSQEDRRAVELQLTEKGKVQAERYEKEQEARTARMFACLTQEEKEQLSEILGRMLRSWDEDR